MWTSTNLFSSFPVALRRILLWGIPSLAILGLVGMARMRWLSISEPKKKRPTSPTPAGATDALSSPKSGSAELQSTSDDSGLVDDVRSSGGKREQQPTSHKNYADVSTWIHPTPCVHTMRTSSNVRLPSCSKSHNDDLDNEEPLKLELYANCDLKQPNSCCREGVKYEESGTEADISGEGGLSISSNGRTSSGGGSPLSANHPVSGEVKPCTDPDSSSRKIDGTDCCQHHTESKESDSEVSIPATSKSASINRKDRVRVQLQLPRDIVGRFIGKQGRNIKALMVDSDGAHVYINQKSLPKDALIVPCTVQGTAKQVDEALAIIESKFPEIVVAENLNSNSPVQQTTSITSPLFVPSTTTPVKDCSEAWDMQLVPASIPTKSFSAVVSFIETLRYVWLVSCERSLELDEQHQNMSFAYCYGTTRHDFVSSERDYDLLGKFCAVRVSEIHWLRGCVTGFGDGLSTYEVQLVDYGSCVVVYPSSLKPLKKEHCKLPVQAFKTLLAHVKPNTEKMGEGLVTMQQMLEGMPLEVHITGKINLSEEEENEKNISAWFPSLHSTCVTAEPKENGEHPKVPTSPGSEDKTTLAAPGDPGEIKKVCSSNTGVCGKRQKDFSSSGESGDAIPSEEVSSDAKKALSSPRVVGEEQKISGSVECIKGEELLSSPSGMSAGGDNDKSNPLGQNGEENSSSGDLGDVKEASEEGRPVLLVEEVEMDLCKDMPGLAPYIPVVEIYTLLGAQTPTFINRELVELGYAIWIEEKKDT